MHAACVLGLLYDKPALQLPATSIPSPSLTQHSKMPLQLPYNLLACRRHGQPAPPNPHAETFLAFGRVFSGVIREGATVQVRFDLLLVWIGNHTCNTYIKSS